MNKSQSDDLSTMQVVVAGVVIVVIMVVFSLCQGIAEHARFAEYAKSNNCTWQATGSAYGDDRDYVCK